ARTVAALVALAACGCAPRASRQSAPHYEPDDLTCRFVAAYVRIPDEQGHVLLGSGWYRPAALHSSLDPAWARENSVLLASDPQLKAMIDTFMALPAGPRPLPCGPGNRGPWRGPEWTRPSPRRETSSGADTAYGFERPYFSADGRYAIVAGAWPSPGGLNCDAAVVENRFGVWRRLPTRSVDCGGRIARRVPNVGDGLLRP
ncbi:MAG TPA: hypothetical protein VG939_09770, partial [Caulobacteraceae bacterium]|nr:hypothetical protein [Caulobacteraceae bacterium]